MRKIGPVLTSVQVCQILQISPRSLQRMRREGLVRYVKLRGAVRFNMRDVLSLLGQPSWLLNCECFDGAACKCYSTASGSVQ